ncbi:MAG: tRNA (guanosine(46)-N7)-methyltransferase TrmB [Candidatus Cloacimonetes bacterium]|nr:tRNA (guanosine(46)-N7)-methyltransferase TrmB [Candidatus Cloacimonadota bacterium]
MSRRLVNEKILQEVEQKRSIFQIEAEKGKHFNFEEIYGNEQPVVLEIGIGRGEYLVGQSLLDWQHNYLGIEVNKERITYTLRQLQPRRHCNVRVLDLFVDDSLIEYIPAGSIRKVCIIHPDPWPKRRHNQRRLIQHKFLDVLYQILEERGVLEIQTDHAEYAQWILRHFAERSDFAPIRGGSTKIPRHGHIVTYFEEKKMREGNYPVYISYRKVEKQPETGSEDGLEETE